MTGRYVVREQGMDTSPARWLRAVRTCVPTRKTVRVITAAHLTFITRAHCPLSVESFHSSRGECENGVFNMRHALTLQSNQLKVGYGRQRQKTESGSLEMKGHSAAVVQATVVNIPGLDR